MNLAVHLAWLLLRAVCPIGDMQSFDLTYDPQMSQMFRGTMKVKAERSAGGGGAGGGGSAVPLTLEELDRPSHCPESVDEDSWLHLVKIRRTKIDSEKAIARLETDIAGV